MKKLLLSLLVLSATTVFAQVEVIKNEPTCEGVAYAQLLKTKTLNAKLIDLLADADESIEEIAEIQRLAKELAQIACE